ncbi:hypothetical protein COE80_25725 [Bacillus pseudomycoides]|uniref:hypothetical protein n=1 Tax=Bacillus pseudomycoides TaxID=64104 RepID=UPI0001A1544C|nr:hypothetical protein [Bacillus pseudomycoides]EEM02206.1 hypothetical protein bmyco0002_54860 [Bacillus pseudomycoides]PEJ21574.1 hypothetical protein CN887_25060 [Bacillus pseudomycoides]PGC40852.1 hypothetical protein COM18_13695 [Bacillus pseudomycoides]PHB18336.1 hypothetical protein COE80_25725 [Bacillus pseudomycoides]
MKNLDITFFMKNNQKIHAQMQGHKKEVMSEIEFMGFSGVRSFGNLVIKMDEVLAIEILEGDTVEKLPELGEVDPRTIFSRNNPNI